MIVDHLVGELLHLVVVRVLQRELAAIDVDLVRGQGNGGNLRIVHRCGGRQDEKDVHGTSCAEEGSRERKGSRSAAAERLFRGDVADQHRPLAIKAAAAIGVIPRIFGIPVSTASPA